MSGRTILASIFVVALVVWLAPVADAKTTADIILLVDESGSMNTEHAWISGMVQSLDAKLVAAGVGNNRYGVVGFGSAQHVGDPDQIPHKHTLSGADWGVAADITANMNPQFLASGGIEDGWAAIQYAIASYSFRPEAAVNFILITDEDRDDTVNLSYANVEKLLAGHDVLLNAIVDNNFGIPTAGGALGVDAALNAYFADGGGGYNKVAGGIIGSGFGTTKTDYVDLALGSGGAAWDLKQLRVGGDTAVSFTAAFVDVKVSEIIPEPGTILLLGAGLGLLGVTVRRRRRR
jgi:hypothetical protein